MRRWVWVSAWIFGGVGSLYSLGGCKPGSTSNPSALGDRSGTGPVLGFAWVNNSPMYQIPDSVSDNPGMAYATDLQNLPVLALVECPDTASLDRLLDSNHRIEAVAPRQLNPPTSCVVVPGARLFDADTLSLTLDRVMNMALLPNAPLDRDLFVDGMTLYLALRDRPDRPFEDSRPFHRYWSALEASFDDGDLRGPRDTFSKNAVLWEQLFNPCVTAEPMDLHASLRGEKARAFECDRQRSLAVPRNASLEQSKQRLVAFTVKNVDWATRSSVRSQIAAGRREHELYTALTSSTPADPRVWDPRGYARDDYGFAVEPQSQVLSGAVEHTQGTALGLTRDLNQGICSQPGVECRKFKSIDAANDFARSQMAGQGPFTGGDWRAARSAGGRTVGTSSRSRREPRERRRGRVPKSQSTPDPRSTAPSPSDDGSEGDFQLPINPSRFDGNEASASTRSSRPRTALPPLRDLENPRSLDSIKMGSEDDSVDSSGILTPRSSADVGGTLPRAADMTSPQSLPFRPGTKASSRVTMVSEKTARP